MHGQQAVSASGKRPSKDKQHQKQRCSKAGTGQVGTEPNKEGLLQHTVYNAHVCGATVRWLVEHIEGTSIGCWWLCRIILQYTIW